MLACGVNKWMHDFVVNAAVAVEGKEPPVRLEQPIHLETLIIGQSLLFSLLSDTGDVLQ